MGQIIDIEWLRLLFFYIEKHSSRFQTIVVKLVCVHGIFMIERKIMENIDIEILFFDWGVIELICTLYLIGIISFRLLIYFCCLFEFWAVLKRSKSRVVDFSTFCNHWANSRSFFYTIPRHKIIILLFFPDFTRYDRHAPIEYTIR